MSDNGDIKIVSELIPGNKDAALVDSCYVRGGIHNVTSFDDISQLSNDLKKPGMIFYVEDNNEYFKLLPSGDLEVFVDTSGFLGETDIAAGDNIVIDTSDGKVTIGAVIGDIPDNQVFSEEVVDVQAELPVVNITTTSNPRLLVNKQDKVDGELATDDKSIVGAINEVMEGMQKNEREAIAAAIGLPASSNDNAFQLANRITECNVTIAPSLRSGGVSIPKNNPTYNEIVSAVKKAFGAGSLDTDAAKQGTYLSMYYREIKETTGDYAWYRYQDYTAAEAKQYAITRGPYEILLPREFDNIMVIGFIYTGDSKFLTYMKKDTYDQYVKSFIIFSIKDVYNGGATDINGRFSLVIKLQVEKEKINPSFTKLSTLPSATGGYARIVNKSGKTYFSYEMNGVSNKTDDDGQYWDSYCDCIYAWNNA